MEALTTLTPQQLRKAADIQERILALQKELSVLLVLQPTPQPVAASPTARTRSGKRRLSPEGRARIIAAAKARWARERGNGPSAAAPANRPKRRMSAAARARIAAGMRAKWAARKAGH